MVCEKAEQTIDDRLEFLNERKLPVMLTPRAGQSLQALLTGERDALAARLRRYGAILFRGFDLTTPEDFREVAALCFDKGFRNYIGA